MKFNKSFFVGLATVSFLVGMSGCSTGLKPSSEPASEEKETLVILGTNDIHGGLAPVTLKTREKHGQPEIQYQAGGAAVISSFVKKLRSEFGSHFIWLDGGDEFQGSIESNLALGSPMVQFFNATGLNAAAIGNHEFDFGLDALKARMKEAHYPYLAANISDKSSGKPADFPNTHGSILIQAGKLKVGVIGLSTLDTPTTTQAKNVATFNFDDMAIAAKHEADALRKAGANIVLLTTHSGLKCDLSRNHSGRQFLKATDPQGDCGEQDEVVQLLRNLPPNTLDAVISGHTHQIVHHWIQDVPVIQAGAFGRYVNVLYLTYDWSQKKLIPQETRIEGPIPVCPKVFQNQNDCNGDRPAPKNGRGPLVPFKFHGETITEDPQIVALLQPTLDSSKLVKEKVLAKAARPIDHPQFNESPLGNLVADAMRSSIRTDFAYVNSGGIRAPIEHGPVTYGDIFRSIPFDNRVVKLQIYPKELNLILRVALNGSRGFGAISGLRVKLIDPRFDVPMSGVNANRLLEVTLPNGEPLDPNRLYTLATLDYLVTGGDDQKYPMSKIPADRIDMNAGPIVREAVAQYVEKKRILNDEEHPLVDPENRRLKLVRAPKEKGKHRKKGKRARIAQPQSS